jgi:Domain of unknown function (DUF4276)
MSLRFVLYAEGPADSEGTFELQCRPGDGLIEESLGPAHILVRRCVTAARRHVPPSAVLFEEPLRTGRSVRARGSDLLDSSTLRRLLTWIDLKKRPDLAVVLVDSDNDSDRKKRLCEAVATVKAPHVIGVAVQEFESWLIADHEAVTKVMPSASDAPPAIEALQPRQAKDLLRDWHGKLAREKTTQEVRLSLAQLCDLDVLARRCPAFEQFQQDLDAALRRLE